MIYIVRLHLQFQDEVAFMWNEGRGMSLSKAGTP